MATPEQDVAQAPPAPERPRTRTRAVESPFLTEEEAAAYLRIGRATLTTLRDRQQGPPHRKHGKGRVLYRISDLDAWSDAQARGVGKRSEER